MNVAEAKRGMVRTEADEAGEEGKCQICRLSIVSHDEDFALHLKSN